MLELESAIFLQVRIARIFNTYGPRMCIDDGRVVSNFVAQVRFFFFLLMARFGQTQKSSWPVVPIGFFLLENIIFKFYAKDSHMLLILNPYKFCNLL